MSATSRLETPELLSTQPQDPSERPVPAGRRRRLAPFVRAWRQLTSMRTALLLLFLLALAAVPGSLLPQRSTDPTLVDLYIARHPKLGPFLDRLGGFDVFGSAVVLLDLRAALRLADRLPGSRASGCTSGRCCGARRRPRRIPPGCHPVFVSRRSRRRSRFSRQAVRCCADGGSGWRATSASVSAEKGYLRETGNLLFHVSLVILLAGIAVGGLFGYTGKVVVTDGDGFTNTLVQYDSFNHGGLVNTDQLAPFTFNLTDFQAEYQPRRHPQDVSRVRHSDQEAWRDPDEARHRGERPAEDR